MKNLKLADHRLDLFDHGVEGADPITREGTDLSDDLAGEVVAVAEANRVSLVEVEETTGEEEPAVNATDGAAELAAAEGIDLSLVEGSGDNGRVQKPDVEKLVQERDGASDTPAGV